MFYYSFPLKRATLFENVSPVTGNVCGFCSKLIIIQERDVWRNIYNSLETSGHTLYRVTFTLAITCTMIVAICFGAALLNYTGLLYTLV